MLVTGRTGFTGTALVKRLIEQGHDVVGLDYQEGLQCDVLRAHGAEIVIGSVTDQEAVERSMKGVELVFDLAAAFRQLNMPNSFITKSTCAAPGCPRGPRRHGVLKFIYCSTCGVHGNVDHPPANEDAPIQPAAPRQIRMSGFFDGRRVSAPLKLQPQGGGGPSGRPPDVGVN